MAKSIAIIGGGAAGFFTAINIAMKSSNYIITIFEASNKLLSKVLVSGGGRCNVTNVISNPRELANHYPRGHNYLESVFKKFTTTDTQNWFKNQGILLKTESDGRIFPKSDSSQTIYNCFVQNAKELGVNVKLKHRLIKMIYTQGQWKLNFNNTNTKHDIVILATGINSGILNIINDLAISSVKPVPSLFTFNSKNHRQRKLSGVSVPNALVSINQIPSRIENGPLLITHWGYSGPSILKLSSWLAIEMEAHNYEFTLTINWNNYDLKSLNELLSSFVKNNTKQKVKNWNGHNLPKRLWLDLFELSGFKEYVNWSEIGKKGISKLINLLTKYEVEIRGKSTHKEEFVSAGGINLDSLNTDSFAIKNHKNLYAVGELLNIDALTGGFNFQAAWSGSYIISDHLSSNS